MIEVAVEVVPLELIGLPEDTAACFLRMTPKHAEQDVDIPLSSCTPLTCADGVALMSQELNMHFNLETTRESLNNKV
jgi:hypothetical protein